MTIKQTSPVYLYKYIGNIEFARQIIQTNSLYMSSATEFNDPFDLNIHPNVDIGDERMEKYSRNLIETNEKIRNKITDDQLKEYFDKKVYASPEGKNHLLQGAMMGILSHGVCCFTTHECNLKFWSLYSNDYSGVCLKFRPDYSRRPFEQSSDVKYGTEYPPVSIDEYDKFDDLYLYKHLDWADEKEWRIILKKSAKERVKFHCEELDSIICGYNMKARDIEKIQSWMILSESAEFYRPKLFISKRNKKEFGIEYCEVKLFE
jgi:hypothetical protein